MRTITILSLAAIAATAAKPACTVNVNRSPVDSLALCLPGVGAKKLIPLCAAAGLK